MSHPAQRKFCRQVRRRFRPFFRDCIVVDVGSLDINGSNRYLFKGCDYTGIDVFPGRNVDLIGPAHVKLPEVSQRKRPVLRIGGTIHRAYNGVSNITTIISTEALEHDKYWKKTLQAMYDELRSGGMLLITCAGIGREEHGTYNHHSWTSPGTNDYYCNVSNEMFSSVLKPDMFSVYHLQQVNTDLQFYGIKNQD